MRINMCIKKVCLLFLLLLSFSLISCSEWLNEWLPDDPRLWYTDDINDYNTEKYSLEHYDFFPDEIPNNATVLGFHNWSEYDIAWEVYLELKFNSLSEMQDYINNLIDRVTQEKESLYQATIEGGRWYVEVENIGDPTYTDLIFASTFFESGYESNSDGSFFVRLPSISYSEKDLIVVHSSSNGRFKSKQENTRLPIYFERFNIPTDVPVERWYTFKRIDLS